MNLASILIVDDEPDNFEVVETFLSQSPLDTEATATYHLHYADSGPAAIAGLDSYQPDLILLDVMMPGMDGIEVCQRIKAMARWKAVPIIMVTALASKQDLARCLAAGADDFIAKPVSRVELTARVRSMLRIHDQYQQLLTFNTRLEQLVQQRTVQLQVLILEDELTQLPSRAGLLQQLTTALNAKAPGLALAYIDCDQFKLVNGAFGYGVGNQLLQAIAQRLRGHLRGNDCLARIGEDEFCFLLHGITEPDTMEAWADAILQDFHAPFTVANCEIFMSACIGIALNTEVNMPPDTLLQAADTAMYKAKLRNKGCYEVFDQQLHIATLHRLTLESDLQRALDHQEFVTYYQPIVNLSTQEISGFEALVRWQHPEQGMVPPGQFIACMEETGLVVRVGIVVLRQACQQLCHWHRQGWTHLNMSVNLSVRQFMSPTLLTDIDQVLAETGVNPMHLRLEITESAIMENASVAIELMEALRSRHIKIGIDDFGTGYSSLGYLHQFPLDILKIDRSFVHQIQGGSRNYQVVETILTLSNQLNLAVVAEGVETVEQLQWLKHLGCEFGQGYLFSKPVPATAIDPSALGQPLELIVP